jgi:nucleotide-binding universal stress UspA family protein
MTTAFTRVLVPTDFSETAKVAMDYASDLANAFQATLHVMHVLENITPTGGWAAGERYAPPPAALIEPMEHEVRAELKEVLGTLRPQPAKALVVVRAGSPFVEIVRYAREQDIDLIVMGTHGRGPVAHMLLGSVADNVIRKAPCPVLTVRHPAHEFVPP